LLLVRISVFTFCIRFLIEPMGRVAQALRVFNAGRACTWKFRFCVGSLDRVNGSNLVHSTSSSIKHYISTIAGRSTIDSGPSVCGEKLAAFLMATSSVLLTGYYTAAAWEFADTMAEALALAKELVTL
jgi:hypothetical protein